ncbi:archease [Amycolatopsis cynarae]|uniref:Archease n=1 Tax=Amycolatopsis cynarae TaxID=2995223 RepID=A0ABY7BC64_9PSEU|nr:archease [Amycolatopsis sp. HUAS 11-8]WAL68476.1 archease [Amycolatopsis sp. HUAS 11-8]
MTGSGARGHRTAAHTADLRVEAWGPTREDCIAQAVAGMVESFAGAGLPAPEATAECEVTGEEDTDLLAAALDEVIYRLETTGEIPAATEVSPRPGGLRLRFRTVDAGALPAVGAIPKAVSLHELRCERGPDRWWCSATIDV